MDKIDVLSLLKKKRLISVVRIDSDNPVEVMDAIIKGGVSFIEVTLTMKNAFEIIGHLSEKYKDNNDVVIGAGTVLDDVSCRLAIDRGASFIVAPTFSANVALMCNLYRIAYIPGVHNPNDIQCALQSGADVLKLFPASTLEPFVIKEFKGPFPQADFIISGKINEENANQWLESGALAVCFGSVITNEEKHGFESIVEKSKALTELVGK